MNRETTPPTLAEPGAGIPWVERWVGNAILRWNMRRYAPDSTAGMIRSLRDDLSALATSHADRAQEQILISRLPGLEDSSRFWSLCMVLDHLRIVNEAAASTLAVLGRGRTPDRIVGTADVKPSASAALDVIEPFRASCDAVNAAMEKIPDPRKTPKYPHPWFGPFDAGQWHYIIGFHMGLHERQMHAILAAGSFR